MEIYLHNREQAKGSIENQMCATYDSQEPVQIILQRDFDVSVR
jgi:hypothetical protein